MPSPLVVSQQRTYPMPLDKTFAFTLRVPLDAVFSRRFGPLPPVSEAKLDGAPGEWSTAGQTRTVHTSDGGTLHETLLTVDAPNSFSYELQDVTGPLKLVAASIDGRWSFEPVGSGTRITWQWTIHPASAASVLTFPLLRPLWHGYARRALDRLEELLLAD